MNPSRSATPWLFIIMKFSNRFLLLTAALTCLLLSACGDKASAPPPEPLDPSALVTTIRDHFTSAPSETQTVVDEFIKNYEGKKYIPAYQSLDKLSAQSSLKQDSRVLISRALLTVNDLINKAAEQGDKDSRKLMRSIQLNK